MSCLFGILFIREIPTRGSGDCCLSFRKVLCKYFPDFFLVDIQGLAYVAGVFLCWGFGVREKSCTFAVPKGGRSSVFLRGGVRAGRRGEKKRKKDLRIKKRILPLKTKTEKTFWGKGGEVRQAKK